MKQMMHWHREAFSVFPVGWEIEVNEFDFADAGGTAYEKNGVKVIHWPASHAKDGASGYRLDWNNLSFCFTGDTRPNTLDIEYCKGVDVMISETQPEVVAISSGVQGVPPFVGRYTIDTTIRRPTTEVALQSLVLHSNGEGQNLSPFSS